MASLINRARMTTATTGTGTVTLGSAVAGFLTFAEAGAVNATTYPYVIEEGDDFEMGQGTYTSSGTTFSRDTVTVSKISGTAGTSKMNLAGTAAIFITPRASDLNDASLITTGTVGTARLGSGTANSGSFLRGDQSWQAVSVPSEASQADMESASGSTQMVTPRRVKDSPFAAKAWCKWGVTTTIDASAGVSSITDNGTGDWTLNWSTAFSSANYAVVYNIEATGTTYPGLQWFRAIRNGGQSAGSVRVMAADAGFGGVADPTKNHVVAFGDQ